jgi:hypothetical protein
MLEVSRSVPSPSGKATVCKTVIPQFKSGWHLQRFERLRVTVVRPGPRTGPRMGPWGPAPAGRSRGAPSRAECSGHNRKHVVPDGFRRVSRPGVSLGRYGFNMADDPRISASAMELLRSIEATEPPWPEPEMSPVLQELIDAGYAIGESKTDEHGVPTFHVKEIRKSQLVKVDPATCEHPRDRVRSAGVQGVPGAFCGDCDERVECHHPKTRQRNPLGGPKGPVMCMWCGEQYGG